MLTKYKTIYEETLRQIVGGEIERGDRLPSEIEIAKKYEVSRPTVTKALTALQNEGYLSRSRGSGTYVVFDRNRSEQTGHRHFGLLVPTMGEIYQPITNRMASLAHESNFSLLWASSSFDSQHSQSQAFKQAATRYINQDAVDGVFFVPIEYVANAAQVNAEIVDILRSAQLPVVLIESDFLPFPQRSEFDLVGFDDIRCGYLATKHYLDQGARRVDFTQQPNSHSAVNARMRGYRLALAEAGIAPSQQWEHEGDPADVGFVWRCVDNGAANVVCSNDEMAMEMMHTLRAIGTDVPLQVRVLGFDDVKFARLARVALTTFRRQCDTIGEMAVETMLHRLQYPDCRTVTVMATSELIVRDSSIIP